MSSEENIVGRPVFWRSVASQPVCSAGASQMLCIAVGSGYFIFQQSSCQ